MSKNINLREKRAELTRLIKQHLTGPSPFGGGFLRNVNPTERFPCGAVYPVFEGEGEDPADTEYPAVIGKHINPEEDGEEPEPIRRYVPPSSIGLSFYLTGDNAAIEVDFFASHYTYNNNNRYWEHDVYPPVYARYTAPADSTTREPVSELIWDNRASTYVLWRKHGEGRIVTVTLCNNQKMNVFYDSSAAFAKERAEKTLFEARFEVRITNGRLCDYPGADRSLLDDEEQETELQYRNRKVYAIGHGTGADWDTDKDGKIRCLETSAIPEAEVPQTLAAAVSGIAPDLKFLSGAAENKDTVIDELKKFINGYAVWAEKQKNEASDFPQQDKTIANRITDRMTEALMRMQTGIDLLESDDTALLAFSLANTAVYNQMKQSDTRKTAERTYKWRPFQLAFLLTVIESAINSDSKYRDLVDLIWFPTGGGKTEAYCGLIAFVILYRRLKYPGTSGGTAVLMRYTLRLLTKDQFLRASRLICALELIRRTRDDLGKTPISIGMWTGSETSPNTCAAAYKIVTEAQKSQRVPALVIYKCPWCGREFTPENYIVSTDDFYFICTNNNCPFGAAGDRLPCNIIDECLYNDPPTLIIGTIDKFARMPWEKRIAHFFGKQGNRPPELIIQDELHLIAGALGSVSGLYEAALDTIIKLRGLYPKYIASTATIRCARTQIKKLYGRDYAVFPPPGINCDDSYFAKTEPISDKHPGRLYLGYFAPMLNRQKNLAPPAAALLAYPALLFTGDINEDILADAWRTGIIYHGTLKGLANSHMVLDYDVPELMERIISEIKYAEEGQLDEKLRFIYDNKDKITEQLSQRVKPIVEELTSHIPAAENAETFERLAIRYPDTGYIDIALATNMISVGLDVSRLALMAVNGQPLTTAEYIQATSRVGRADIPGIIFVNYYRDQARSLSHYEQFKAYHSAFYKYVEPTSVTPFTRQARDKALHAALVSVIRHGIDGIDEAADFSADNDRVRRAVDMLKTRCAEADEALADDVIRHIDILTGLWEETAAQYKESGVWFKYCAAGDRACESLLYNPGDTVKGIWPTLQSMRNVEDTALLIEILPKKEV